MSQLYMGNRLEVTHGHIQASMPPQVELAKAHSSISASQAGGSVWLG